VLRSTFVAGSHISGLPQRQARDHLVAERHRLSLVMPQHRNRNALFSVSAES
jgi:hypothetical protein